MSPVLPSPLAMAIPDGALEHSFGDEEPKVVGYLEKIKPTEKTRNFRSSAARHLPKFRIHTQDLPPRGRAHLSGNG
jgi:hypothetical protein